MEVGAMTGLMAVLVLLFAVSCGPGGEPSESPPPTNSERPAWLDEEPIIIVGGWDDMPLFRPGGQPEDLARRRTSRPTPRSGSSS